MKNLYGKNFIQRQETIRGARPQFLTDIYQQLTDLWGNVSGLKVLDIGCAVGSASCELAAQGARVIGVDFTLEALCSARKSAMDANLDCKFICADLATLELRGKFDIITAVSVVEHLTDEKLRAVLKMCRKHLKDGGRLIIETHPTKYDYLFFDRWCLPLLLVVCWLPEKLFKNIVRLIDSTLSQFVWKLGLSQSPLNVRGVSRAEASKRWEHCNLTTEERLAELLKDAGFTTDKVLLQNSYPPHDDRYYTSTIKNDRYLRFISALFGRREYFKRELYVVASKSFEH